MSGIVDFVNIFLQKMMHLKPRLDNDLYQRLLLILAASLPFFYLLPYSLYFLPVLTVTVGFLLATLKSSLQLEVQKIASLLVLEKSDRFSVPTRLMAKLC